jgi:uncharacterized protein YfcZ (UPF0381/DUF406 family)
MLFLRCIVRAILYGIIACFFVIIPALVIWVIASIIWSEAVGKKLADLITFLSIVGAMIYGFKSPIWEEEERRKAFEAEEAARLRQQKEEQEKHRIAMITLGDQSLGLFELLPQYLDSAEKELDQAEVDFADGAFAPFWDSIENAAKYLAHFNEGIQRIKSNATYYTELIGKYRDTPPQFPLARQSIEKLGVGKATAERMQAIVRKAQCNFQFAMIYEQRKTNKILIAGFTDLAQALEEMTWQITASINDLTGSVNDSMRVIHSRLGDIIEITSQQYKERSSREKKALEMLDNIQRGRRPFL